MVAEQTLNMRTPLWLIANKSRNRPINNPSRLLPWIVREMLRLQARFLTKPIKPWPKLQKKDKQIKENRESESVELTVG